jgi:hypothetical protein
MPANAILPLGNIDLRTPNIGPQNIKNRNLGFGSGVNLAPDTVYYDAADVNNFLSKIDYGPYIKLLYDCDNRAYWGLAHLRHRFPGIPSGMISTTNEKGEPHAVIMYYVKGSNQPICFDPNGPKPVRCKEASSAIAFPLPHLGEASNSTPPFTKLKVQNNIGFFYNESYFIYPKQAIIDYLTNRGYDQHCQTRPKQEDHAIYYPIEFQSGGLWTSYDDALWALVHLRRQFPGCAVGVARGTKVDGVSSSTIIIYYYQNDVKTIKPAYCYWDTKANKLVQFNPGIIIY